MGGIVEWLQSGEEMERMKIGYRKPRIKSSLKARTTGRAKRSVKKSINPMYGKKGVGFAKNPRHSVKNAVYRRTTFGTMDILKKLFK